MERKRVTFITSGIRLVYSEVCLRSLVKGVRMIKAPNLFTAACFALCGMASAYTITGTVSDNDGKALKGVTVDLLKEGKTAKTDDSGKFTIHEDEIDVAIHPAYKNSVGYISINNSILSYSQSSTSPVQVKIYNSLGNQVFKKTLQGSGTYLCRLCQAEFQVHDGRKFHQLLRLASKRPHERRRPRRITPLYARRL